MGSVGGVCLKCKKETGVKIATAACYYKEGPARDLVNALKFEGKYEVANVIANVITSIINSKSLITQDCTYVVPIPLDKKRYRERGYNQSLLIAKELAKQIGLEVIDILTKELRRPQVGLTKKERKKNIEGAFGAKLGKQLPKSVILIDDVITTGSTIKEAVKVLKRAGIKEVRVISFSRD
jgi:competence protein ComFC